MSDTTRRIFSLICNSANVEKHKHSSVESSVHVLLNVLPFQERNRKSEVRVIYIYRNVYIICISIVYAKHRKQQHNNDSKVSHVPSFFFPNPTQVQLGKLLMPPGRPPISKEASNALPLVRGLRCSKIGQL